jgi:hypothetical protein
VSSDRPFTKKILSALKNFTIRRSCSTLHNPIKPQRIIIICKGCCARRSIRLLRNGRKTPVGVYLSRTTRLLHDKGKIVELLTRTRRRHRRFKSFHFRFSSRVLVHLFPSLRFFILQFLGRFYRGFPHNKISFSLIVQVAQRRELLNSVHSVFVFLVPIDVSIVYSKNRRISRSSIKIYILLSDGLERDVES